MTIRLQVWLGAMACAALLLTTFGLLATALDSRVVAGVVALAIFAPIAWLLARLVFYPVRDVTKTARSIVATGELDRRCFYPGPRDDVGDLVVTVNELLVRYDLALGRIRRLQEAPPARGCPRQGTFPDPADLVPELPRRDAKERDDRPPSAFSPPES
jgi:hypothetical protein